MNRFSTAKTAIALACVVLSGAAGAQTKGDPNFVPLVAGYCVSFQAGGRMVALSSARAMRGGGTVIDVIPGALTGTDGLLSRQGGLNRLEPVSFSIGGFADIKAIGTILKYSVGNSDPRQQFIDISGFASDMRTFSSQRFVRPWLSGISVPELNFNEPGPANFLVEFVAELREAGATPCFGKSERDQIADKSRFVVEAPGLPNNAALRVGTFKLDFPKIPVRPAGPDSRMQQTYVAGNPTYSPVTLTLLSVRAGGWARWFQETLTGKGTKNNVTIRLLDVKGQPGVSIVLYDAWPSQFTPQYVDDPGAERTSVVLQYSRAEIQ